MKQANFKNVKVGQRFMDQTGKRFVKIRPCCIDGTMRNAVRIEVGNYFLFGNISVSILEDDEA